MNKFVSVFVIVSLLFVALPIAVADDAQLIWGKSGVGTFNYLVNFGDWNGNISLNANPRYYDWSSDGSMLVVGSNIPSYVYYASNFSVLTTISPGDYSNVADFSNDGKFLFLGLNNQDNRVYNVGSWTLNKSAMFSSGAIISGRFSPDSQRVAWGSNLGHFRVVSVPALNSLFVDFVAGSNLVKSVD